MSVILVIVLIAALMGTDFWLWRRLRALWGRVNLKREELAKRGLEDDAD